MGNQILQRFNEQVFPIDAIQIKKYRAVQQLLGRWVRHPVLEVALPYSQWLSPLAIGRHHIALAIGVATGGQAVADERRQGMEVLVVLFGDEVIRENQRIILVGDNALLITRHGAIDHIAIRHWRRPKGIFCQFQQPASKAASNRRERTAHHLRVSALLHHAYERRSNVRRQLGKPLGAGLVEDIAHQIKTALGFIANNIGKVHDPHRALAVKHRQVMHVVTQHSQHCFIY